MRIPAQIADHPVESFVAVALLLALLIGSAETDHGVQAAKAPTQVATEKM